MPELLLATLIVGAIAFVIGEVFAKEAAHNKKRVFKRYIPAIIIFVALMMLYVFLSNLGTA
jgi:uncharacterized membrane protein YsdA (DUF1294 family)